VSKSIHLKLPSLLSQFLYQHKKLNLPGIGIFTLDPSAVIPDEPDKDLQSIAHSIEFKNVVVREPDNELVEFIHIHTGKMTPLAASDLDSYLTIGTQLLNIGKPFYLEGIGTLVKTKEGKLDFTPGEYSTLKLDDKNEEKKDKAGKKKPANVESYDKYEPDTSENNGVRKILLVVGIIIGLAVIGWGGYSLYKNNIPDENENDNSKVIKKDTIKSQPDSTSLTSLQADTLQSKKPKIAQSGPLNGDSVLYKFILLETNNKYKALRRYNQLLSFLLKIKMETTDSNFFKVYFTFPALPKDTLRIKDSLNRVYANKIIIEQ
jgi:hypothetical protein